jgi:chromosome segregation protein
MLKSLELFGFKSFADRTLFEFASGITCVVGPNGSGKSNVVDALKWILGDQSAKSLRGKEMADVIFNGSAGRRASGFAEATLTFDNTHGQLPIDAAEVQIGRRLYQSGDSEYLLNRSAVRLKDIKDLFLGTGAGTAAYSIIEQGRVDQILQSNPTARRVVFEEAAGISKFKSRRVDAERRLERVAQNLLRLTDIVDEVETQLNSTRSQASKAARFRELSAELNELWTGLAADDDRHLSIQVEEHRRRLEGLEAEHSELQQSLERLETEQQRIEERIAALDDELLGRERTIATAREAIAGHESTIRHQSSRRKEIEADLHRVRTQRASLSQRIAFAQGELAETEQQLEDFETRFQRSQTELSQRERQLDELREQARERRRGIDELRQRLTEQQQGKSKAGERLVVVDSQAETLTQNREQLQSELEQAETAVQTAHAERIARERELTEAEQAHRQAQERLSELQSQRSGLAHQREETGRQLNQLRERRSAAQARLSVLEELEHRQEGIAIGVRDILRRAETSHYPPWNRVLGLVRDLIEVPLDLAPLIEAALGERAQLIAVAELAPMLDYLNRGPAPIEGRVGFVAVHPESGGMRSDESDHESGDEGTGDFDLMHHEGVYGRADRLVAESPRALGLAEQVLSDTWIVETLDVARRIAPLAPRVRFVTLQGELLVGEEALFVGTVPHESSIVSRKSELRALKNEIQQLGKNIEQAADRQVILSESLQSRDEELEQASEELKVRATQVTECSTRLAGQNRDVERLEAAYRETLKRIESLDQKGITLNEERTQLNRSIVEAEQAADELQRRITQEEQQLTEIDTLLSETQNTIKTEQVELAKHEERLSSLRQTQSRLNREHQQRIRHREELIEQAGEVRAGLSRCDFEILHAESAIATLALEVEAVHHASREFLEERDRLRHRRNELSRQAEEQDRQRRKLADQQRQIEFEVQKLEHQRTTLEQRIREEFSTPLQEFVDAGASAYRTFLVERYGEEAVREAEDGGERAEGKRGRGDGATGGRGDEGEMTNDQSPIPNDKSSPPSPLSDAPSFPEVREELEARVDRLRRKVKAIGNVNTDALDSLEELEVRYETLSRQLQDLEQAKSALEDIIRRINGESRRIFLETFETIRGHFQELFRKLFGGGDADIILEDPDDVLECGIDIVARPPGKELRSISLLSGGEKTMTAVAMLFAMFKSKPSPYCILDEVDAALDDANVDRYATVLKEFVEMTQFVVITHRKRTMTAADVLYGVTMEQAGVSKRISVRFEDVSDNGEIRTAA